MRFGDYRVEVISDCEFRLDGGAMFGVVPRNLWSQVSPPDDQNRILMNMNCLFIEAGEERILIDTGIGDKWAEKHRGMYAIDRRRSLDESLRAIAGIGADEVTIVINTHLHFDHAGGNTVRENGAIVPTFPRAKYFVQGGEYEDAARANERTRASYRRENFTPVAHVDQWEFMDGETELVPGVSVVVTEGHTRHHQSIKIESEGQIAFYLGDLIPTVSHLPLPYIMGYDLYPLQTLETKRWVLDRALSENWLLVFEHDPRVLMGRVRKDIEGKFYLEEVKG